MDTRNMFNSNCKSGQGGFNYRRDWENQNVTQINREQIHSPWGAYENISQAISCDRYISGNVLSLASYCCLIRKKV